MKTWKTFGSVLPRQMRAILLLFTIPIFTVVCSLVAVFIYAPFLSRQKCDELISWWSGSLLKLSNVKVQVLGLDNLAGLPSMILVSNHASHFDIPVLYHALPLSFRMAAKSELFKVPFFGQAMKAFGFFPVVRENPENAKKTLQAIAQKFSSGESVWMAPEGTRFQGQGLGQFKTGAFYLAIKTGQVIVPVVIYGTQKVLPKGSCLINWKQKTAEILVQVCPPISVAHWPLEKRHVLRDQVRAQMVSEFSSLAQTM